MSVYVIGAGGIGCLVAMPVAKKYTVNFIVRNPTKREYLKNHGNKVYFRQIYKNAPPNAEVEYRIAGASAAADVTGKIESLIVSVKTFDTVKALKPLKDRLDSKSNILLVQNGMGVIDELYEQLWPEASTRPTFYQGVIAHGVYQELEQNNTYNFVHAGYSGLKLCKLPRDLDHPEQIEHDGQVEHAAGFIQALVESDLNVTYHQYKDLLVYQVQKLGVNSCMNTNTSIFNCVNHELENEWTPELFKQILTEQHAIFTTALPILKQSELYDKVLTVQALVDYAILTGFRINGKNSTSMRQDTLNLRDVEVDYISGYAVRLAKKVGIPSPVNRTIQLQVKTRLDINRSRAATKANHAMETE